MEDQNQFIPPQVIPTPEPPINTLLPVKKKMKLWKKVIISLLLLAVLLGMGLYNTPRILNILYPNDSVLNDNSDLMIQKMTISDDDNGFYDLEKISSTTLKIPSKEVDGTLLSFTSEYTDIKNKSLWDQNLVDKVLKDNEDNLKNFYIATSKKYIQVPQLSDPLLISVSTRLPGYNIWRQTAQLAVIKSRSLAFEGKSKEALEEAIKLNKIGSAIIVNPGVMIGGLVGIAIKNIGSTQAIQVVSIGKFKNNDLINAIKYLQDYNNTIDDYKKIIKSEYINSINNMDFLKRSLTSELIPGTEDSVYSKLSYYFKENQTKNLITDGFRAQVSVIGNKCYVDDSVLEKINSRRNLIDKSNFFYKENSIGILMSSVVVGTYNVFVTKQCQTDLLTNVLIIELALKAYKNDNNILPHTLNELVPKYLESIPEDPFDHKPIRYSVGKKILYSVGLKQKDLGGSAGDDWTKMENPTFKIEF